MDQSRRAAVAALVACALAPLWPGGQAGAAPLPAACKSPINIIVPSGWTPLVDSMPDEELRRRLTRATMDFIQSGYAGRKLPLWGRPLDQVDLEKRVYNLTHWIIEGVRQHLSVYPVDPAWVLGQMMTESFFNEFAVSYAFAVGVCQFIPPTAREYGMSCAGDSPAHAAPPYKLVEFAGQYKTYLEARDRLRELRGANARLNDCEFRLREALTAIVSGQPLPTAKAHLAYLDKAEALNAEIREARKRFKDYLEANFAGRDIFDPADAVYLRAFDARTTYRDPVPAMVLMLARALKARNGNMLAAAAAYHAGLGNTEDDGVYEAYGRIPSFESTVTYVSRLVINHYEIARRLA